MDISYVPTNMLATGDAELIAGETELLLPSRSLPHNGRPMAPTDPIQIAQLIVTHNDRANVANQLAADLLNMELSRYEWWLEQEDTTDEMR